MENKKFIYGIAAVRFGDDTIGYIEKGSWDWGGQKPEVTDVDAEQVPDAPVLTLVDSDSTLRPTFNLIQLDYGNLQKVMGGSLVVDDNTGTVTGWEAPTEILQLCGKWFIDFLSGQSIVISNGTIAANLGGKLTLTEVSKIECQLVIDRPSGGGSAYRIGQTNDTCKLLCYLANGGGNDGEVMLESVATGVTDEDCTVYVFYPRGMEKDGHYYFVPAVFNSAYGYAKHFNRYGQWQTVLYQRNDNVLFYEESEDMTLTGSFRGEEIVPERASGGEWHRLTAGSSLSAAVRGAAPNSSYVVKVAARNMGTSDASLQVRFRTVTTYGNAETLTWSGADHSEQEAILTPPEASQPMYIEIGNVSGLTSNACIDYVIIEKMM